MTAPPEMPVQSYVYLDPAEILAVMAATAKEEK